MSKIAVAVDDLSLEETFALVSKVGDRVYAVKIHDFYDLYGPGVVQDLLARGAPRVWVDFKLHDIPRTVERRAHALARSGASIITVHASGGDEMMKAARLGAPDAEIYAVTVLTSLEKLIAQRIYNRPPSEQVFNLAFDAAQSGMTGVVCSPQEVGEISPSPFLKDLKFVVPGIRSEGKETHDQKRVGTPLQAVKDGASLLVIGRQITEAKDPLAALAEIEAEIATA